MQFCTAVRGNTVPMASRKPVRPSTTAIRISCRPWVLISFITLSQNLALGLLDLQPQDLLVAFRGDRQGEVDRLVPHPALVADLDP